MRKIATKDVIVSVFVAVLALDLSLGCSSNNESESDNDSSGMYEQISGLLNQCVIPHQCILRYNSALVTEESCCYAIGGENHCDTSIECNELSGEGCCLIYATDNTSFGQSCCLYADGSTPFTADGEDNTEACNKLLNFGGGPASSDYCAEVDGSEPSVNEYADSSSCLLEYNSALVVDGQDSCCFYNGGFNHCDLTSTCNDLAGEGCCLLYATDHTAGGQGCCLYADGSEPTTAGGVDRTQECAALMYLQQQDHIEQLLDDNCPHYAGSEERIQRVGVLDRALNVYDPFLEELLSLNEGGNISLGFTEK